MSARKTSVRLLLLPACLAGLATLTAGCKGHQTPVEIGNREQVLHLGNLSEPKDLDPHVVTGVTEHNVISALLEGLVSEDPATLEPVPGTAESWAVSDDGSVYTFRIRADARWSDGSAVTSRDFAFSFRRILSPKLGSPYAYMLYCLKNAEAFNKGETADFDAVGVRCIDDATLELTLDRPVPYFLSLLNHFSWFPVHSRTVLAAGAPDAIGTKWTRPGSYVGNGPFVLASWEPGKRITVRKSPTYWDRESVRLKEIHFHAIGDHKIEERAFRAGQLHVTGTVPLDRIEHYRRNAPHLLRLDPYLGTYYFLLNVKKPPLDNTRVRRALSLAVNREQLVRHVTKGGEDPAYHFTPPGAGGYKPQAGFSADPERARQLLAEAGYPGGRGLPKLSLLYNTSDAHARIAQAVQQMWKTTLGIDVELVNMEWKVYLAQTQEAKYDIARAGWIGDYADPNTFLDLWVTGGGNNRAGWSDPRYDALIAEANSTVETERRHVALARAEQLLMEEMPIIPLYFYRSKTLIQPSVKGWHPTLLDHHPYKHVYLDP